MPTQQSLDPATYTTDELVEAIDYYKRTISGIGPLNTFRCRAAAKSLRADQAIFQQELDRRRSV